MCDVRCDQTATVASLGPFPLGLLMLCVKTVTSTDDPEMLPPTSCSAGMAFHHLISGGWWADRLAVDMTDKLCVSTQILRMQLMQVEVVSMRLFPAPTCLYFISPLHLQPPSLGPKLGRLVPVRSPGVSTSVCRGKWEGRRK